MALLNFFHDHHYFYLFSFILAFVMSFIFCPIFRAIAIRYNIFDHPDADIKIHQFATPYLAGASIALAFILSLIIFYLLSPDQLGLNPTSLIIFSGGLIIVALGLVDDIIKGGLSFKIKFAIQFIVSTVFVLFGMQTHFVQADWLFYPFAIIWLIGIMNAINIIDMMDGLAGSTIIIASLGFLLISLPAEAIYIKLSAALLAGSTLGYLPFNFSKKNKMFMGDTGSLLAGYILGVLSLSTHYSSHHAYILAPVLILGVPIFDTLFVMLLRYRKGISPFRGSKDHSAMRLEKMGYTRYSIVLIAAATSVSLCGCAWLTTQVGIYESLSICTFALILFYLTGTWLAKVKI